MTIILVLFLFGVIYYYWKTRTSKPPNFPPGPPRYPIIGSAPYITPPNSNEPNPFWGIQKLKKEYGEIFGMYLGSTRAVVLTNYDDIKTLFNMDEVLGRPPTAPNHLTQLGHETLENVEPEINKHHTPGVIFTNGRYWTEQRRFLLRNLRDFGFGKASMEDDLQEEVQKLIDYVKPKIGTPCSLNRTLNISIVNALWFILAGEKLELNDPKLNELTEAIDDVLRKSPGPFNVVAQFLPHPNMCWLPGLKQLSKLDVLENCFSRLTSFVSKTLQEHIKTFDNDYNRDFFDLMISEVKKTTDPKSSFYGKTGEFAIINDMIDLYFAGMETTSSSLNWSFLYLLHFPDIQAKIHMEIDEKVGRNRLPSLDDRKDMPYIEAFLQEVHRCSSLVPMSVFHYTLKDLNHKGYHIPKDTIVISSLYDVMHDASYFKDPEIFRPERFLDEDGNFVADDHVVPFGIGRRFCLGRSLAEKEFYLFFAGFIQNYNLENVPGIKPPPFGVDDVHVSAIIRSPPMFEMILRPRDSS